jgi:hypothetical protein
VFSVTLAAAQAGTGSRPSLKADPGGVGGVPFVGPFVQVFQAPSILLETDGLLLDGLGQPVPAQLVVVLDSHGTLVGSCLSDADGQFELFLPAVDGMTAAIPLAGISDLPVVAGSQILIIIP